MGAPWEQYGPTPTAGPWAKYQPTPFSQFDNLQPAPGGPLPSAGGQGEGADYGPLKKGSVLPIATDQFGGVHFDPSAGLMGAAINAFTLPGDVMAGKVDPMGQEGIQRSANAAMMLSPMSPASAYAKAAAVAVPSAAELKAVGGAGRNAVRQMGIEYDPQAVVGLAAQTQADLMRTGLGPQVAKDTNAVLAELQKLPAAGPGERVSADFTTTVEAARANLQSIAQGAMDGQERRAASQAISALDQFIKQPPPAGVVAGDAAAAGKLFSESNANYAAGSRGQTIDAIGTRGELRADATGSGRNFDNSVRGKVASFIEPSLNGGPSRAERSGFTDTEINLLKSVVAGKTSTNALRFLSNILGGGGGLGTAISAGMGAAGGAGAAAATGNPLMMGLAIAPPAIGFGLKTAENALTRRQLSGTSDALRMRSPAYRDAQAAAGTQSTNPQARAQLIKMLLLEAEQGAHAPPLIDTRMPVYAPGGGRVY